MTEVTPLLLSAAGKSAACATSAVSIVCLLLGATVLAVGLRKIAFLWREKFIHRELEVLEKSTRILGVTSAFLVGHTEIIGRHQQLDVPLQLDDAELAQRNVKLTAFVGNHQIIVTASAAVSRYLGNGIIAAGIQYLAAQHHGINHFHNSHRQIGALQILNILRAGDKVRTENTRAAFTAEQHGTFVVDGQTTNSLWPANAAEGIQRYFVEITHINRKKATVIGYGLYVDIGPQQFCSFGLDVDGVFQDRLGRCGEIDANVFQAFFFAAGVVNFPRMDANSLTRRGIPAERAGGNLFRHIDKPPVSD